MSDAEPVLKIALPLPLPRLFDYRTPPQQAMASADGIGRRVRVPFGTRELVGLVAAVGAQETPGAELKSALAYLDDGALFHGELLASLRWLAAYTHAPLGEVLATALPAALRRGEPLPDTHLWAWQLTPAGEAGMTQLRNGSRPRRLAEWLQVQQRDEDALDAELDGWRNAARTLAQRGLAERVAVPASQLAPHPQPGPMPNEEQATAIAAIEACDGFAPFLLDGVTGSGKTEVYLQAIAQCLARGRQALVLVPEIGLTPQMLGRFRARLGVPVHALHSGLNDGERARTWAAAWRGEARVIVGTRSAVFTPLPDAGLIVIDEEHDASYKQQDGIRYHARDFALVRGKALDVPVLLGSATPSLESLHNAHQGRYRHLRLHKRAGDAKPPSVRVLDVRKRPLDAGLSPELQAAIRSALDAGGQVLVFKNRRGYAPVLLCHDCGWSAHCKRCDAPMTVHAGGRRLQCHHCGARQTTPPACPDCASLGLQPQGVGTERIEEVLAGKYADVPVLRIDRGSTRRKDALEKLFEKFGAQPGVLVGTQMLAKGHDLPNLTLVAVVGIDEGLFSADFRAGEKLAQLLIQVSGRAGRAEKPGEVWLQTHHPEHPLLQTLINGGYHAFAEAELAQREAAGFPPFAHLALLRAEAKQADAPMAFLHAVKKAFSPFEKGGQGGRAQPLASQRLAVAGAPSRERGPGIAERFALDVAVQQQNQEQIPPTPPFSKGGIAVQGPIPAPMPKRAGMYRAQLLLSSPNRRALHAALEAALPEIYALPEARKVRWSLDVDPMDLY